MNFLRTLAASAALTLASSAVSTFAFAGNGTLDLVGNLNIEIKKLKSQKGSVCVSMFENSNGFPDDGTKAIRSGCFEVTEIPLRITFEGLKFTNYAIALFHDENKDGKLNTGLFGIPTEGFGFSNNPAVRPGAPKFNECGFLVAGSNTDMSIELKSL